jgi:hypothetical protein
MVDIIDAIETTATMIMTVDEAAETMIDDGMTIDGAVTTDDVMTMAKGDIIMTVAKTTVGGEMVMRVKDTIDATIVIDIIPVEIIETRMLPKVEAPAGNPKSTPRKKYPQQSQQIPPVLDVVHHLHLLPHLGRPRRNVVLIAVPLTVALLPAIVDIRQVLALNPLDLEMLIAMSLPIALPRLLSLGMNLHPLLVDREEIVLDVKSDGGLGDLLLPHLAGAVLGVQFMPETDLLLKRMRRYHDYCLVTDL